MFQILSPAGISGGGRAIWNNCPIQGIGYSSRNIIHSRRRNSYIDEELVEDPGHVTQKICTHLAVSSDDSPASYLKNTLVHSLSDEQTRESVDVKKIMDARSPVYEDWAKEQQNIFKDICGNAMEKLKYEIPF